MAAEWWANPLWAASNNPHAMMNTAMMRFMKCSPLFDNSVDRLSIGAERQRLAVFRHRVTIVFCARVVIRPSTRGHFAITLRDVPRFRQGLRVVKRYNCLDRVRVHLAHSNHDVHLIAQ